MTYQNAGVNIDAGNELVQKIKQTIHQTKREEVISDIGGFSGAVTIPKQYQTPVLVSATDGVGTKLRLAIDHNKLAGIGIDLVAMCVNDIIVCGAEPLTFLDYYATGQLDIAVAEQVIASIAAGCLQANCSLIGGETAEMPGMYQNNDFDLAGFCQGVVERKKIINGNNIQAGDVIIGLASNGFHSNGYSLIRSIINNCSVDTNQMIDSIAMIDYLLQPTTIYVKQLLDLYQKITVHGVAHITGGGLTENIPRVLPRGVGAQIDLNSWQVPAIMQYLIECGNVTESEKLRVFNCGIGMVVIVAPKDTKMVLELLNIFSPKVIGHIVNSDCKIAFNV